MFFLNWLSIKQLLQITNIFFIISCIRGRDPFSFFHWFWGKFLIAIVDYTTTSNLSFFRSYTFLEVILLVMMLKQKANLPSSSFDYFCFHIGRHLCPFPFSLKCICIGEFLIEFSMVKVFIFLKNSEYFCIALHGNFFSWAFTNFLSS